MTNGVYPVNARLVQRLKMNSYNSSYQQTNEKTVFTSYKLQNSISICGL